MKRWLKGSKGLTLIELLAVIVILGVIAAIAIPAIGKSIANSKIKADLATYDMIRDAAIRYSLDKQSEGSTGNITKGSIKTQLQDTGYLTDFKAQAQSDPAVVFTDVEVTVTSGITTVNIYGSASKLITRGATALTIAS